MRGECNNKKKNKPVEWKNKNRGCEQHVEAIIVDSGTLLMAVARHKFHRLMWVLVEDLLIIDTEKIVTKKWEKEKINKSLSK